jgi:hypothetical protein
MAGYFISEVIMEGSVMRKLAEALDDVGFVIKSIEEEKHGTYDRPNTGEIYTGQIIIKIRSRKDEEAEAEAARLRKEKERIIAAGAAALGKPENDETPF